MHTVSRSLILPYRAPEMYSLVDDIAKYREFLPWCQHSEVLNRTETEVIAKIGVSFRGLRTEFTTRNQFVAGQEITMCLVEGPFHELGGEWCFNTLDDGVCQVSVEVRFSLAGRFADKTIGPVFTQICTSLVQSFADRAKDLYGERRFA